MTLPHDSPMTQLLKSSPIAYLLTTAMYLLMTCNLCLNHLYLPLNTGSSNHHHNRIIAMMEAGLSAGAWRNKAEQAKKYIAYMQLLHANPFNPTQYQVLSYLIHLTDELIAPTLIMNYCSGARTFVRAFRGCAKAFNTYPVAPLKRGIRRSSTHVPAHYPDIPQSCHLLLQNSQRQRACHIHCSPDCLLHAHASEQSSRTTSLSHTLRVSDITVNAYGLNVHVRSSKTAWASAPPTNIAVPAIPGSDFCPVCAWTYVSTTKPYLSGPAFVISDGFPLRPKALRNMLRLALSAVGHPVPGAITLHSLRRGEAQPCAKTGASLQAIKELGSWSSSAVFSNIPRHSIKRAGQTLSSLFG